MYEYPPALFIEFTFIISTIKKPLIIKLGEIEAETLTHALRKDNFVELDGVFYNTNTITSYTTNLIIKK